jgi:nucleoside-specific outer membrane channel protein Tsx
MKRMAPTLVVTLALLALGSGLAQAAIWSSTSASVLYGTKNQAVVFDAEANAPVGMDQDRTIITLEHADGWKYGDNFFFFDIAEPFANESGIYGEWHPRFSFGKMTGSNTSFGFVKDVLIATELNVDSGWRAYLYGLGFDLDIPNFNFFAINFFIRDDMTIKDESTFQISPSWNVPFSLGSAKFEFGGFLDYSGAEGDGEYQLLTQPQLLLDVSALQDKPGNLYLGIEYQYWKNKYGIKGIDENYVQFMGKWVF